MKLDSFCVYVHLINQIERTSIRGEFRNFSNGGLIVADKKKSKV